MYFSKKIIIEIMTDFKNSKRVFTNELQFQFEFAVKLKEKGYNVLFEVMSKKDEEKIYTDLVVDLGDKRFVAIELKYKSAGKPESKKDINGYDKEKNMFIYGTYPGNSLPQCISPQGAEDEGSYNFLNDINRLELLRDGNYIFAQDENNEVVQAYAIIMANGRKDSKSAYWYERKTRSDEKPLWIKSSLSQGRKIKRAEELGGWSIGGRQKASLKLKNDYTLKWEPYLSEDTDYPIQYMIVCVK